MTSPASPWHAAIQTVTAPTCFEDIRIEAGRVVLRMICSLDAPVLYGVFSNTDVTRYWSRPAMTDPEEAVRLVQMIIDGYATGKILQLGVERRSDSTLLGTATLFHFDWQNLRAEIGYALGRPYWGQGWMAEAIAALVRYAFVELGLNRLEADIDPRNLGSARSLLRQGFELEGTLRERWIVNGEVSDTGFYGLLRRNWAARTEQR